MYELLLDYKEVRDRRVRSHQRMAGLKEFSEGSHCCSGNRYRFLALALGSGIEPVALNQVVECGCPILSINNLVKLLLEVVCHLAPLFAEQVGLFVKNPWLFAQGLADEIALS